MDLHYWTYELAYGDSKAAMRVLYEYFSPRLVPFVRSEVKSDADAEEIVLSTLYDVWDGRYRLPAVRNVQAYVFRIARNKIYDYLKSRKRQPDFTDADSPEARNAASMSPDPHSRMVESELMMRLQHAVDSLPEKSRMAFRLVREYGFKYREAAEIMGISVKTLEAHIALAMKRLLGILED